MSCDKTPDFERILSDKETNNIIETLVKDQAFTTAFLASCIANYYVTVLKKGGADEDKNYS